MLGRSESGTIFGNVRSEQWRLSSVDVILPARIGLKIWPRLEEKVFELYTLPLLFLDTFHSSAAFAQILNRGHKAKESPCKILLGVK